jgi:trans-L-3-hydroxyproline dehydratase
VTQSVRTIDAHVGGQPLRLIVEGLPRAVGKTLVRKREWLRTHADAIRRGIVLEPRGHADLVAAVLTEPASPEAHAGLITGEHTFFLEDDDPCREGFGLETG